MSENSEILTDIVFVDRNGIAIAEQQESGRDQ
jgi:hypothetical protein